MEAQTQALSVIDVAKEKFELACKDAANLQIINNFTAAFTAVNVVTLLREALTDEVMKKVFMPLANTKIGFLTDRSGKPNSRGEVKAPYSIEIVRDVIIDGVCLGLMPVGNQMNIIAERMYPTKEGYTALLRKLGVKYFIDISYDKGQTPNFAEIPCKINYEYNGEKNSFAVVATVKKDQYSSHDQLRGKAERRAKKALYEYITGTDLGDAGDDDVKVQDIAFTDVTHVVDAQIKAEANGETLSVNPTPNATPTPSPEEAAFNQEHPASTQNPPAADPQAPQTPPAPQPVGQQPMPEIFAQR